MAVFAAELIDRHPDLWAAATLYSANIRWMARDLRLG
jgi:predicted nucleic acid-binding protein